MLVKMDASAASTFSGDVDENGVIEGSEVELYNDYSEVKITTLNRLVDAVYKDNSTVLEDARTAFLGYSNWGQQINADEFPNKVTRKIVVDINLLDVAGAKKTQVIVHNEYAISAAYYNPYTVTELATPNNVIYESTTQYPRDIYIYYYPNYGGGDAVTEKSELCDQFVINNNDNLDVSVHLIRLLPSGYDDAVLASNEAAYKTAVSLNDDVSDDINTKIYSNLKDDLTKSDEDNAANRQNANRCKFTLNNIVYDMASTEYRSIVDDNGGLETVTKDRLYSVVIEVYEEGAAAAGFPEDMRVAIYDGASAKQ